MLIGQCTITDLEIILYLHKNPGAGVGEISRFINVPAKQVPVYMKRIRGRGLVESNIMPSRIGAEYKLTPDGEKIIDYIKGWL